MTTILVVDDEHAIVQAIADLLRDEGYRVVVATNGEEGLSRLHSENPDLVLLDVMMPGIDGHAMLTEMRESHAFQRMPVILMSAGQRFASGLTSLDPFLTFLAKPFHVQDLLDSMRRLLDLGHNRNSG